MKLMEWRTKKISMFNDTRYHVIITVRTILSKSLDRLEEQQSWYETVHISILVPRILYFWTKALTDPVIESNT